MLEALAQLFLALAAALLAAFVALLEVSAALMGLLLEALGFSVAAINEKPGPGRPRFTARRLALALTPWLVLLVCGGVAYGFFSRPGRVHAGQLAQTRALMIRVADDHEARSAPDEPYAPLPAGSRGPQDAWGTPLRLNTATDPLGHGLIVRSRGPDRVSDTADDLIEARTRPTAIRSGAGRAATAVWHKLTNRTQPAPVPKD